MIPLPVDSYLPDDIQVKSAGACPGHFTARLFEQGSVSLDIGIQPGGKFKGKLELRGPSRFLDSRMTVKVSERASVPVWLSDCAGATECTFETLNMDAQEVSVLIPAFEVEGSRRELSPIRFSKRSSRNWCAIPLSDLMRQ